MAGVPSRDCQGNWGIPGYLDKGGGGGFQYFYCMAGVPSWDCQGNWGIPGYLDKGGGGSSTSTVWQEYRPGTVRVTGESRDTWTKGGGGFQYFYCMAGVPSWDCQGNWGIPGYLDKGGGGSSTSTVWQEYRPGTVRVTGESRDTWTKGGGGSSTSTIRQEYSPGTVRVTGESRDTWTKGGGVPVLLLYGRSTVLGLSG